MNALERLEKMLTDGHITVEEYKAQVARHKGQNKAMTAEQIIAYLEMELADAYEQHDEAKGVDAREALVHLIRATTILNILEAIKDNRN